MALTKIRRWPKGTYMQLRDPDALATFVGPEPDKRISGRRLALRIGKHPSFVAHLLHGRSTTCKPETAHAIAEVLGLPVTMLFDPKTPSGASQIAKRAKQANPRKVAA